jgi:hypothetical protein
MKTGREEALAECLASLDKGGSIEWCLARYPGLASELEPLLRTVLGLRQAYDVGPRPAFQRAARQRFLAMASRRGRRPLAVAAPPRRFGFGWRWVPAALGTAALVVFVAWATVLALGRGGGSTPNGHMTVLQISPTPTPAAVATEIPSPPVPSEIPQLVARAQEQFTAIRAQVEGGETLQPQAIQDLRDATQSLVQSLQDPAAALPQEDAPRIQGLLADQQQVLKQAKEQDQVPPEAADDLDDTIAIAQAGAIRIEELLSPTATPTSSPSPTPTPASTGSPAASPTATATQAASATGTPRPVSSLTPGPAGAETILPMTPTPSP